MGDGHETPYVLALEFDSDDPQFRRGFEMGQLWNGVQDILGRRAADDLMHREPVPLGVMAHVHADCAEMVMRIAEATGCRFRATPNGEDWLVVMIELPLPEAGV